MWITSMGNHGVAGDISERRGSSCYSFIKNGNLFKHYYIPKLNKVEGENTGFTLSICPSVPLNKVEGGYQSSRKTFLATSPVGLVIDKAH